MSRMQPMKIGVVTRTLWALLFIVGGLVVGSCAKGDGPTGPTSLVPAAVEFIAGNGQSAIVAASVPVSPAVAVRTASGTVVSGVMVTFAVASGGGSVTGASATTNASGIATLGGWTLGQSPGPNSLDARVSAVPDARIWATGYPAGGGAIEVALDSSGFTRVSSATVPGRAFEFSVSDALGRPAPALLTFTEATPNDGWVLFALASDDSTGLEALYYGDPSSASSLLRAHSISGTADDHPSVIFIPAGVVLGVKLALGAYSIWQLGANGVKVIKGQDAIRQFRLQLGNDGSGCFTYSQISNLLRTRSDVTRGQTQTVISSITLPLGVVGGAALKPLIGDLGASVATFGMEQVLSGGTDAVQEFLLGLLNDGLNAPQLQLADGRKVRLWFETHDVPEGTNTTRVAGVAILPDDPSCTRIRIVSGDNQVLQAGSPLPDPIVVSVLDDADQPLSNVTVDFSPLGGGQVGANSAVTNALGEAATTWSPSSGSSTLRVTIRGQSSGAQTLTVLPGQTLPTLSLAATAITFQVFSASGNPPPRSIGVSNGGTGLLTALRIGAINYDVGQPTDWLNASLDSAGAPTTVVLSALVGALPPGTFGATVEVRSDSLNVGNSPAIITVTLVMKSLASPQISAGYVHTCSVSPTGAASCWGENWSGQLGDESTTHRSTPVAVAGGLSFRAVSAANQYTCGVAVSGAGYCWGANSVGQLGNGTTTTSNAPVAISGNLSFRSVSAGWRSACGVTTEGVAYCWGQNESGLLGTGGLSNSSVPVQLVGGLTFASVSVGSRRACGVTTAGTLYCWGYNVDGFLGDGSTTNRSTPVLVSGSLRFLSVSVGDSHACAIASDGLAYCWGSAAASGGAVSSRIPVVVSGGVTFGEISAGLGHTCGLGTNGTAYCWGSNVFGELGDGSKTSRNTPAPVSGGLQFESVSAGRDYSCGTTAEAVYCWGNGLFGNLGDGNTARFQLRPQPVAGDRTWLAVSAGDSYDYGTYALTTAGQHFYWGGGGDLAFTPAQWVDGITYQALSTVRGRHTCGLSTSGAAYCWGSNTYGQLGVPNGWVAVSWAAVSGGLTFESVTAGGLHTCGLTAAGAAFCWGANVHGQLGDGTNTSRSSPTPVSGGLTFRSLSAGYSHTCGVTTAGLAYCWGRNEFNELGDGSTTNRNTPNLVSGGLTFTMVSAGGHTCAVTAGGTAYCWGSNGDGQLGDGSFTNRSVPVAVLGGLTFETVTAAQHTCGITPSGTAFCWGWNWAGELGDGTTTNRGAPVQVSGGLIFRSLSLGSEHTCGITTIGAAYCWGFNQYGALGTGRLLYSTTPTRAQTF